GRWIGPVASIEGRFCGRQPALWPHPDARTGAIRHRPSGAACGIRISAARSRSMKLLALLGSAAVALLLALSATGATLYSADFAGGIAGWTTSGNVDADQGRMRLRGTASATRAVSTVGYTAVSVEFAMSAGSLEAGDYCHAEVSVDGGAAWTTALSLGNGQDDGSQHTATVSPAGIDNNPQVVLRFRGTGATTGEY